MITGWAWTLCTHYESGWTKALGSTSPHSNGVSRPLYECQLRPGIPWPSKDLAFPVLRVWLFWPMAIGNFGGSWGRCRYVHLPWDCRSLSGREVVGSARQLRDECH